MYAAAICASRLALRRYFTSSVGSRPAERPASHCRREVVILGLRLKLIVDSIGDGVLGEKG